MAETVRRSTEKAIGELKGEHPKRPQVGLAENAKGVAFQCGTCEYFDDGTCRNKDPELEGKEVQAEWCCDLYDHDGMRVIIE